MLANIPTSEQLATVLNGLKKLYVVAGLKKRETGISVKKWRKLVFERDGYKCVECGSEKELQAHHIQEWSEKKSLRYKIENGLTLCKNCHSKKHPKISSFVNSSKCHSKGAHEHDR